MVLNILKDKIMNMLENNPSYQNSLDKIKHKKLDPYQAAEDLISNLFTDIISNYPKNIQKN